MSPMHVPRGDPADQQQNVPCRYEFQCQYGSIGWSVGATLGSALALKVHKRVIAFIGDGSFQVTATVSI